MTDKIVIKNIKKSFSSGSESQAVIDPGAANPR
jgi:hypothetical protein